MSYSSMFRSFIKDDQGAVSIDWVVLTASIVSIGILVGSYVNSIPGEVTADVDSYATSVDPVTGSTSAGDDG